MPANARAYELASFSGAESVGIIELLMEMDEPSKEIITSVNAAMQWLDEHKIMGIRVDNQPGPDGKRNKVVVEDANAPPLLARFDDLETGLPFSVTVMALRKIHWQKSELSAAMATAGTQTHLHPCRRNTASG